MQKTNKIILWTKGIDGLILEEGKVGGLTIQMYFWALTLIENGKIAYSFTEREGQQLEGIKFLKYPNIKGVGVITEWFISFFYLMKIRPEIVIIRGARRGLFYLTVFQIFFKFKLVFFGASDSDFEVGKELISVSKFNVSLYRKGLRKCELIIVQNKNQETLLKRAYGKNSLVINNIWYNKIQNKDVKPNYDAIWVGNFRKLKRPEYFIQLARQHPQKKFVMIGGSIDAALYNSVKSESANIDNLDFLGTVPFRKTSSYFRESKILICSSLIEGFPNTFIQAFSAGVPIITTFDPSNIIEENNLGYVVKTQDELSDKFNYLLSDKEYYNIIKRNCIEYFNKNYNSLSNYKKFIDFIKHEK